MMTQQNIRKLKKFLQRLSNPKQSSHVLKHSMFDVTDPEDVAYGIDYLKKFNTNRMRDLINSQECPICLEKWEEIPFENYERVLMSSNGICGHTVCRTCYDHLDRRICVICKT